MMVGNGGEVNFTIRTQGIRDSDMSRMEMEIIIVGWVAMEFRTKCDE